MSLSGDRSNCTLRGNFSSSHSAPGDLSIQWTAPTVLFIIITVLTFLLGLPGKGAVVKMKRTVHTVCFLNLAVADLTYCLILPFLVASYFVLRPWPQDKLLWMFLFCAFTLIMSASIFLLTLISICRCLAVTRPIWFRQHLRLAWVRAVCFGAWGLSFFTCLPSLLMEQIDVHLGYKTFAVLHIAWVILIFGLSLVIMVACYLLIARELRRDQFAKSKKSVRFIVTLVAAFIVCWLPKTVYSFIQVFQSVTIKWIDVTLSLASFNSALNPLLYVFAGSDFRQVFRRSLASSLNLAFTEEGVPDRELPS